nr:MAG TPA: hypothetical protein [Caudoviricetes sp.]
MSCLRKSYIYSINNNGINPLHIYAPLQIYFITDPLLSCVVCIITIR